MIFDVLQITTKEKWQEVLWELKYFDFGHTYDFHYLSEKNGEGMPIMFVLVDNFSRPLACWPALRRSIEGTNYFDLTSIYGYGGPLFAQGVNVEWALSHIWQAMQNMDIVSVFSRMHPLFVENIPEGDFRGQKLSEVVVIDIKNSLNHLAEYRGSHRREILNAKKHRISVVTDHDFSRFSDFKSIYLNSMRDLNASSFYLFNSEYLDAFKKMDDFKSILIYAEIDGIVISASLFIITGNIMQYYLSGTAAAYRKMAASKIIIAQAHQLAIELGIDKIVLGGGVGSARDALFDFKAGFSNLTKPFYVTKRIFNWEVYNHLCRVKGVNPGATSFFPAYRA